MEEIVKVENLFVTFGTFQAVKNVSFSVPKGEIFGFLGANGAGKTTTIRVLCGLLPATEGKVTIDGIEFVKGRENDIKKRVGYMSQKFTLYDDISINENLEFTASLRRIPEKEFLKRKKELLDFIGFKEKTKSVVRDLPGGIKQEIALVASLLHDPQIIFLDEPTAGVAPAARDKFWKLIRLLSEKGKTVFVTTHYMDEAENCNRIALMRSGELIALNSPERLKAETFQKNMFLIKVKDENARKNLLAEKETFCESLTPYGMHYHALFLDGLNEKKLCRDIAEKYGSAERICPSLEDVFVRLVEGNTR